MSRSKNSYNLKRIINNILSMYNILSIINKEGFISKAIDITYLNANYFDVTACQTKIT